MKRLLWIIPLILFIGVLAIFLYVKLALPNVGPAPEITVALFVRPILHPIRKPALATGPKKLLSTGLKYLPILPMFPRMLETDIIQ